MATEDESADDNTALAAQRQLALEGRNASLLARVLGQINGRLHAMASDHAAVHSKNALDLLKKRTSGEPLGWRERLYLLTNEPSSSVAAYVFSSYITWHVIACCMASMAESVEFVTADTGPGLWMSLRIYFNIVFTIEATMRFMGHMPLKRALLDPILWLDLWSILPFWLRLVAFPSSVTTERYLLRHSRPLTVRTLEASGMARLLKLSSHYYGAELLAKAISRAANELLVPGFLLVILCLACSAMVYDIEWDQGAYDCGQLWQQMGITRLFLLAHPDGPNWDCAVCDANQSALMATRAVDTVDQLCTTCTGFPPGHPECAGVPFAQTFPDIPRAMWFVLVTVTTVGYGDVSPRTWQGQVFSAVMILCGVIFLAMPLNSIGTHFSRAWEERQLHLLKTAMRVQLVKKGISPDDVSAAFEEFDTDGNGLIDGIEFAQFVTKVLKIQMSRTELHQLWHSLDIDGLGAIDFAEFSATLFPQSRKTLEVNLARTEDDGSSAKGAGADSGAPKETFGGKRSSRIDDGDEVLSRFSRSYELGQQQKREKDEAAPDHEGKHSESAATGGPALEAMHVELVELRTAVGGMDERMQRVEAACTGMYELLQGLQSTHSAAKARLRAKASSRASGLGEGLSEVKTHALPPDLPGAVGVGASAPPPADVLARRADIDFVQDAQASMHSTCKDAPGRATSVGASQVGGQQPSNHESAGDALAATTPPTHPGHEIARAAIPAACTTCHSASDLSA